MVSGSTVLQEIDRRIAEASREASAAQSEADRLAARRDGLRAEEAEALRDLARLRLQEIAEGRGAVVALDAAGARVQESLRRRAEEIEGAQRDVRAARDALAAAEARRDAEAARLRAAEEAEAAALRDAEAKAAEDAEYRRLSQAAEEAERIAQHAEQKSAFAVRDFEEKGKPYRADPLFAYLWDRGYGTARYRAMPLVRMIDDWVARLIEFEPARRSYQLLSELPGHMKAHARRMRADADAAVRAMVERRRALAGLSGEGRPSAAALEAAEDAVEAAQAALAEAEAKRSRLASGDDAESRAAVQALEQALAARTLRTLREEASRTPTREDDAIVARLEIAAAERARTETALAELQVQAEAARQRLRELQGLRSDLRTRGVEQSHWGFASGAAVGLLVGEVLRGALSRDGFWDRMERQRMPGPMKGTSRPGPWNRPLPGPWEKPAPGPWAGDGDGGWRSAERGATPWAKPRPGDGGSKGGFATGGTIDQGDGFRTGGRF